MTNEQRLAKALDIALQVMKVQDGEITALKVDLLALRDSVASGKPSLPFGDAQKQVLEETRGSRHTSDDIASLLDEQIAIVRPLAKAPPNKKARPKKARRSRYRAILRF